MVKFEVKFEIKGIITALVTPLTREEEVNEEKFEKLVDFQIKHGVKGLVTGTLGEGYIAHVGTSSTKTTIEPAKNAAYVGADAVSAIGPFFYKPDFKELIKHYKTIGETVNTPLFIYNNSVKTRI